MSLLVSLMSVGGVVGVAGRVPAEAVASVGILLLSRRVHTRRLVLRVEGVVEHGLGDGPTTDPLLGVVGVILDRGRHRGRDGAEGAPRRKAQLGGRRGALQ